jgi:hypothetical protein
MLGRKELLSGSKKTLPVGKDVATGSGAVEPVVIPVAIFAVLTFSESLTDDRIRQTRRRKSPAGKALGVGAIPFCRDC